MSSDATMWNFGRLEATLAALHDVAPSKRTAFQSRLKNLHRLKFPIGFTMQPGKPALYGIGDIVMMAIAVELIQLGLPPERVVHVLGLNWWPAAMAVRIAASSLADRPGGFDPKDVMPDDPMSMFLFFDPSALDPLTIDDGTPFDIETDRAEQSFFYGGQGVVRDSLVKWTTGAARRLSLINVTAMLDRLAGMPLPDVEQNRQWRQKFFRQIAEWSETLENRMSEGGSRRYADAWVRACLTPGADGRTFEEDLQLVDAYLGLRPDAAKAVVKSFRSELEVGDVDPQA